MANGNQISMLDLDSGRKKANLICKKKTSLTNYSKYVITDSFISHIPPLTGALEALNIIPHGRKKKTVNENRSKPTSINGEKRI